MGTKMTLHRYGAVTKDWDEVEYFIDQNFIDTYGSVDPIIPVGTVYEVGAGLVEVYLNGQRISSSNFTEVDDEHIQIHLGVDPETNQPYELSIGEHIYIRVYKNHYCSRGQATISGTEFYTLRKEIYDARKYKDDSIPFISLDARLDEIQRQLMIVQGGKANVDIDYEYNSSGRISREITTGDETLVREFTYYEDEFGGKLRGRIKTETIYYTDDTGNLSQQVTKEYSYDPDTKRLLRVSVRG